MAGTQLRRYEIKPGEMDDFLVAWRGVVARDVRAIAGQVGAILARHEAVDGRDAVDVVQRVGDGLHEGWGHRDLLVDRPCGKAGAGRRGAAALDIGGRDAIFN